MNNFFQKMINEKQKHNKEIDKIIEYVENHSGEEIKLKTKNLFNPLSIEINRTIFLQLMKDLENYNCRMIQNYIELLNRE